MKPNQLNVLGTLKENNRSDNDLDSIEYGTPKGGKIKIYFNTKKDSLDEIKTKIDIEISALNYAIQQFPAEKLVVK